MKSRIEDFYEEWKYYIFGVLLVFTIGLFIYLGTHIRNHYLLPKKFMMSELIVEELIPTPPTSYIPGKKYFDSFMTVDIPSDYTEFQAFDSEEERNRYLAIVDENANFSDESAAFTQEYYVSNANQELYDIADKYYQVYWGSQRVSPIYPLAVANVETGSRADHDITWSALFPSKYVDIQQLYTMDVTTVLSSDSIYNALSKESSTRDRGALQMSPTYGTGNDFFNAQMSGNEKDKLSSVDTSSHSTWANGASDKAGDRFYVPDVCLRLASANTDAIERMTKNDYTPESDIQLVAMLAMYHHRSGVWSSSDHNKSIGEWKSSQHAYDYSKIVSSKEMVAALKQYAQENPDRFWIDADAVKDIFNKHSPQPMSDFASKTLVCTYPLKVEYAYIKLCLMYSK